MIHTTFFRLLKTPMDDKGEALDAAGQAQETFTLNPADLSLIPGSPFAYWVCSALLQLFAALPKVDRPGPDAARQCVNRSPTDSDTVAPHRVKVSRMSGSGSYGSLAIPIVR